LAYPGRNSRRPPPPFCPPGSPGPGRPAAKSSGRTCGTAWLTAGEVSERISAEGGVNRVSIPPAGPVPPRPPPPEQPEAAFPGGAAAGRSPVSSGATPPRSAAGVALRGRGVRVATARRSAVGRLAILASAISPATGGGRRTPATRVRTSVPLSPRVV